MVGHKGQEKTGENQHYISCLYCSLWLNLRIDGKPQRTGEDRRTSILPLLPLLLFVAKQDRYLCAPGSWFAPVGANEDLSLSPRNDLHERVAGKGGQFDHTAALAQFDMSAGIAAGACRLCFRRTLRPPLRSAHAFQARAQATRGLRPASGSSPAQAGPLPRRSTPCAWAPKALRRWNIQSASFEIGSIILENRLRAQADSYDNQAQNYMTNLHLAARHLFDYILDDSALLGRERYADERDALVGERILASVFPAVNLLNRLRRRAV